MAPADRDLPGYTRIAILEPGTQEVPQPISFEMELLLPMPNHVVDY